MAAFVFFLGVDCVVGAFVWYWGMVRLWRWAFRLVDFEKLLGFKVFYLDCFVV